MLKKETALSKVRNFRLKFGIDATDENIITAIHLMNLHGLEHNAAKDQSSRSANDCGIDGWYYDVEDKFLYVYQSKLSENKSLVLKGLKDLERAAEWLETILIEGRLEKAPVDNHMLYGLFLNLSSNKTKLKHIKFVLLSLFDENEIEDETEIDEFKVNLSKSKLNKYLSEKNKGRISVLFEQYSFETGIPRSIKTYDVHKFEESNIVLRSNSSLHLSYVSLYSLVELYRQRGDVLFDKNVRLSLFNTKEAKDRLVHPIFETLDLIVKEKKLKPQIFPFYHVGITITASNATKDGDSQFSLESPGVINGCQTITIAHEYLKKLEKETDEDLKKLQIGLFKEIQVIGKIVVGVTEDELKEITNANNRQNPIENWQLFSNESIHIAIESSLRDIGIFYERQKGKFNAVMKILDNAKYYPSTNGTFVTVTQLAQIVALARNELQMAAKPALIFENKKNHDYIFNKLVYKNPHDIVFCVNIFKSLSRALKKYLEYPTHAENNYTQFIFSKPIVRLHLLYLGLLYYYQSPKTDHIRQDYHVSMLKIASPTLVTHMESIFYQKIVSKFRDWYLAESKKLEVEVSMKKLSLYTNSLCIELGVDIEGAIPFTEYCIEWVSNE